MPLTALLLLTATFLPAASCLLLGLIGRRLSRPLAGWAATSLIGVSLACSLGAMVAWFNGGELAGIAWGPGVQPIEISVRWLPIGFGLAQDHAGFLDAQIYLDSLTIAMFNTITLVAFLIHIFAIGYLADRERFSRFFMSLNLACFALMGLVLCGSLILVAVFWQLLAIATFFLVGFPQNDPARVKTALRSFACMAIADTGLLIAIGFIVQKTGNGSISDVIRMLGYAGPSGIHLPNGTTIYASKMTAVGIAILVSMIARAGLFPLNAWIENLGRASIAGSAFVQSLGAAAGVYVIARLYPIFTPTALLLMAAVGLVSACLGAIQSVAQRDITRVIGFSTMSQIGLMFFSLGIGGINGALFQLITHAFFKALLVLSAAMLVHLMNGQRDLRSMGGLLGRTPLTAFALAIGGLAMIGVPFSSGYYSLQMILERAGSLAAAQASSHHSALCMGLIIAPVASAAMTALAMTRCWMLAFAGRARSERQIRRVAPIQWFPLAALAGISLISGSRILDIKSFLFQSAAETANYSVNNRDTDVRTDAPDESHINPSETTSTTSSFNDSSDWLVRRGVLLLLALGALAGLVLYARGPAWPDALMRLFGMRWMEWLLERGFCLDLLICNTLMLFAAAMGRGAAKVDRLLFGG